MHLFTLLLANNFVGTKVGLQPRSLVTSGYMLIEVGRGGGCCNFPSYHFCVFAKIAIRSIYPPFVPIPMYL